MFVLRSIFWLSTLVMILPASPDGSVPPPRVNIIHTAYAVRALLQDVAGACDRNPDACRTSREALTLLTQKVETGASIVSAGLHAGQSYAESGVDHGTLTTADLEPAWSLPESTPFR